VDHAEPAVREQALEQLLESRASRRNFGPGRPSAAGAWPDVAKLAEQRRQPVVDQLCVERGDIGSGPLNVQIGASVPAQPGSARGTTDVQAEQCWA